MNYDAVIFDMDGLLLDTEVIAMKTFEMACSAFDIKMNKSAYLQCIGSNANRTKEILIENYGPDFPSDKIFELWSEYYHDMAVKIPVSLKPGVTWLLNELKRRKISAAVATSTAYDIAIKKLKNADIFEFFKVIVTGNQVKLSKPQPDIYLKAAAKLNVDPSRCLALEDSENGVKAAYAARMTVFQIPDLAEPSDEIKTLGHTILKSLFDVANYLILIACFYYKLAPCWFFH